MKSFISYIFREYETLDRAVKNNVEVDIYEIENIEELQLYVGVKDAIFHDTKTNLFYRYDKEESYLDDNKSMGDIVIRKPSGTKNIKSLFVFDTPVDENADENIAKSNTDEQTKDDTNLINMLERGEGEDEYVVKKGIGRGLMIKGKDEAIFCVTAGLIAEKNKIGVNEFRIAYSLMLRMLKSKNEWAE